MEIFQVKQTSLENWESVGMRGVSKILATGGVAEFGKVRQCLNILGSKIKSDLLWSSRC